MVVLVEGIVRSISYVQDETVGFSFGFWQVPTFPLQTKGLQHSLPKRGQGSPTKLPLSQTSAWDKVAKPPR